MSCRPVLVRKLLVLVAIAGIGVGIATLPRAAVAGTDLFFTPEAEGKASEQVAIVSARQLIAAGDMNGAVNQLTLYVNSHPEMTDAARFLGDLEYRQGHFDRAEAIYRGLLARDSHDKETHNRLGVVYATENRVDDAIAQFEGALPGTDSMRDLVILHLRKGDLPQYKSQMLRAADAAPTDSDLQEEIGEIFETLHRPYDAIQYFRRALDSDAQSIAALNGLGMAYLDVRDHEAASQVLDRCLSLDSSNYACMDNLGIAYLQTNHEASALEEFTAAHRLAPERPEAVVNFGYVADLHGDWKRAVAYYVQAMSIDPYVPESYVNLGIDYEHSGLYPLAQAALLKGVAAAPYDGRIHYLLGRAYAAQGKTALAIEQLKDAAASFDPDVAQIAREETARLSPSPNAAPQ